MSKYTKWCSRCCLKEACVLCFDCKSTNYCSVCFKAVHSSSKMKFHSSEEISCDAFHKYKGASDKHPQAEKEDTTFK